MPTRGSLLREFPSKAADAILRVAGPATDSPLTIVEVRHLGGAFARTPAVPDAVGGREAAFGVWLSSVIGSEEARGRCRSAVRELIDAVQPWATGGVQINFLGTENSSAEFARAWPDDVAARLATVRQRYDPQALLHYQPSARPAPRPEGGPALPSGAAVLASGGPTAILARRRSTTS